MRLLNFINEKMTDIDIDEVRKNCSEILKIYSGTNKRLYRGLYIETDNIFKTKGPEKRRPVDSSKELHAFANNGFKKVFGKNLRSQSVFCANNLHLVDNYGNVYVIFPSNNFETYWSPFIKDFYNIDSIIKNETDKEILIFFMIHYIIKTKMSWYRYENFSSLLKCNNKIRDLFISIIPKELYEIYSNIENNREFDDINKIYQYLIKKYPNCSKKFVEKYYKKGDIFGAMKSGNEIMITCDYYYGISVYNKSLLSKVLE